MAIQTVMHNVGHGRVFKMTNNSVRWCVQHLLWLSSL